MLGEEGRTRALRDHLQSVDAAHRASTRRLTSRLSDLQGNIDSRLRALTVAFDAYVALGDVREEMRMLPDWRETRAAVSDALDNLMSDQTAQLIDTGVHDHWVAHAMNAVIALVEEWPVARHEARARELSDQAPMLVVTIALALGAGPALDGRLAALFDEKSTFDEDHLLLFRAAVAGMTTPEELRAVGTRLVAHLDRPEHWMKFLGVSMDRVQGLDLVTTFLDGERSLRGGKQPWSPGQLEQQLRTRTATLAQAGSREEAELLERAQTLRRRIEQPNSPPPRPFEPLSVIDAVQDALEHPEVPESSRSILITWIHAPLRSALEGWRELPAPEPEATRVRARLAVEGAPYQTHNIDVTTDGGDREQIRRAKARLSAAEPAGPGHTFRLGLGAAAAVLGFLLLLPGGGWQVLGVLLLLTAAGLVLWGVIGLRRNNNVERAKAAAVALIDTDVREASNRLRDEHRQATAQHAERLAAVERVLTERLPRSPRPVADVVVPDGVGDAAEEEPGRGPDFTSVAQPSWEK